MERDEPARARPAGGTRWGYTLSSEEFDPLDLVEHAREAEAAGFDFVTVSDHYHPWTTTQGHSPFVWATVGGVAATSRRVGIGTGVTCPIQRIHPAIVAQAAATAAVMAPGRFFLGVGTGEALNEHVTGGRWAPVEIRREMLVEAIAVMRALWTGETVDHHGRHFTVENARLFTRPEHAIPIIMAASGPQSAEAAAEHGDGLWSTSPDAEVVRAYRGAGGRGPVYGQLTVCWSDDVEEARATARRVWPNAGVPGQLSQDLPTWTHFEAVASLVSEDDIAREIICTDDPQAVVTGLEAYEEAGFDHVHVHQVGPGQRGFLGFWTARVQPLLRDRSPELERVG